MLQLSMRRNAEELHQVVSELSNWEQAIATQDAQLRGAAPPAAVVAPDEDEEDEEEAIAEAAANRAAARALASSAPAAAPSPRPNRLDAYASWDQYDAEAEASALDQAAAREERKAAKQRKKEAALLAAKRAASEQQAASLRAAGNEAFGRAQYEQASLLYTEALVLHPRSAAAYARAACSMARPGLPAGAAALFPSRRASARTALLPCRAVRCPPALPCAPLPPHLPSYPPRAAAMRTAHWRCSSWASGLRRRRTAPPRCSSTART